MTEPTRELVRELVSLRLSKASVIVRVTDANVTTTLHVVDGSIVGADESEGGEPLGRVLARKGLITQEQYVDILEQVAGGLAHREVLRFGEVAVARGFVSAEDVRTALREQIRWRAIRVFQRPSPAWQIRQLGADRDAANDVSMSLEALVLDAFRWIDDARRASLALGEAAALALRATWALDELDMRFELSGHESDFVRGALAGDQTVTELLAARVPDDVDAHALLTSLLVTGAAATRARIARAEPLPRQAPGRSKPPTTPSLAVVDAQKVRDALARITLARAKGPPSVGRAAKPDPSIEQRLRAEQAFQLGKALLRAGKDHDALVELERATALDVDSREYALFAGWVRHVTRGDALTAESATTFEQLARANLSTNPMHAFGYFVLGEVLRSRGQEDESRRHLRSALRLEPELFQAERARRLQAMRGPPKSKR